MFFFKEAATKFSKVFSRSTLEGKFCTYALLINKIVLILMNKIVPIYKNYLLTLNSTFLVVGLSLNSVCNQNCCGCWNVAKIEIFIICFIFILYQVLFWLYISYLCNMFCYIFIIYLYVHYILFNFVTYFYFHIIWF